VLGEQQPLLRQRRQQQRFMDPLQQDTMLLHACTLSAGTSWCHIGWAPHCTAVQAAAA
jgi:hypothetical protein